MFLARFPKAAERKPVCYLEPFDIISWGFFASRGERLLPSVTHNQFVFWCVGKGNSTILFQASVMLCPDFVVLVLNGRGCVSPVLVEYSVLKSNQIGGMVASLKVGPVLADT